LLCPLARLASDGSGGGDAELRLYKDMGPYDGVRAIFNGVLELYNQVRGEGEGC
jgi:hypothetical protein